MEGDLIKVGLLVTAAICLSSFLGIRQNISKEGGSFQVIEEIGLLGAKLFGRIPKMDESGKEVGNFLEK